MNQIIWSDLAYLTYTEISEHLQNTYSLDTAIKFDQLVEKLLNNLEKFQHFCPKHERRPQYHKCTINKNASLLYWLDGKKIHLVAFYDNRGKHPF